MGTWSWEGILAIALIFLAIFGFILAQIDVTNPLTGIEQSVISYIIDLVF